MTDQMTTEVLRELLFISVGNLRQCKGANDDEARHIFRAIAAIEVLAARLSGKAADAWQPIETAPKDRRVELWIPPYYKGAVGRPTHGEWDNDQYSKRPRPYWHLDLFMRTTDMREQQPSHWREPSASPEPPHV